MAFDAESFKTRALSAVVFVLVMTAGFINHWTFLVLFSIIHFGCWIEYEKLLQKIYPAYKDITRFHQYGVMIAGWVFMLWLTNPAFMIGSLRLQEIAFGMLIVFVVLLPVMETLFSRHIDFKMIGLSSAGLIYISFSLAVLVYLRTIGMDYDKLNHTWSDNGLLLPLIIILCMWVNDTMAYIVGSFIGRTPFSKISPKKTWEGTIGGVILCVVVMGWLAVYFTPQGYPLQGCHWYIIVTIAAIAGTLGDLLESKIKRIAGVKDSGTMMPGHGGFLDRFDSLLIAAPAVWLYVIILTG
ncbi:MAG: phosphatidate cytidylyltransferase [Chitinophagaceae bacterium]|nr:phosphatidate cytidylyltransferase [Chitinophagaceae bacterium]